MSDSTEFIDFIVSSNTNLDMYSSNSVYYYNRPPILNKSFTLKSDALNVKLTHPLNFESMYIQTNSVL